MTTQNSIIIDENLCTGCGLCASTCHQGAIVIENGVAKLQPGNTCDGLGRCLPACPAGAISFANGETQVASSKSQEIHKTTPIPTSTSPTSGALQHWPLQIKLVLPNAPFFAGADLLIAADCAAFACPTFHQDYMHGKITIIGCPKLDDTDYSVKLAQILENDIRSITVARMEVPCCSGLETAAKAALQQYGKNIPIETVILPC